MTTAKKPARHVGMRRLLVLAAFLEKLPPKRFDFGVVCEMVDVGEGETAQDRKPEAKYGSVAGAVGWMPAAFPRHGFRWVRAEWVEHDMGIARKGHKSGSSYGVAARFFALTDNEGEYLFQPNSWENKLAYKATAKQVARHIRAFVKRGGMPKAKD